MKAQSSVAIVGMVLVVLLILVGGLYLFRNTLFGPVIVEGAPDNDTTIINNPTVEKETRTTIVHNTTVRDTNTITEVPASGQTVNNNINNTVIVNNQRGNTTSSD